MTADPYVEAVHAKQALNRAVDRRLAEYARAWQDAWDRVAPDLQAAIDELAARAAAGVPVTPSMIRRAIRLRRSLTAIRAELETALAAAGETLPGTVSDISVMAADAMQRLTTAQLPEPLVAGKLAVDWAKPDPDVIAALIARSVQSITHDWETLPKTVHEDILKVLTRGLTTGQGPREVARDLMRGARAVHDIGGARALTIARTEMLDAYRQADRAYRNANRGVITGWVWLTALDKRTCPACLAMNGREFPPDHPGPEGHQNCRCTSMPTTKTWTELGFHGIPEPPLPVPDTRTWYENQTRDTQVTIMGRERADLLAKDPSLWDKLATRKQTSGWRDSYVPTTTKHLRGETP